MTIMHTKTDITDSMTEYSSNDSDSFFFVSCGIPMVDVNGFLGDGYCCLKDNVDGGPWCGGRRKGNGLLEARWIRGTSSEIKGPIMSCS